MTLDDRSMFSGRKGAALIGVAVVHAIVICGFYLGLAQPIIQHFVPPPLNVGNVQKPPEKVIVRPEPPRIEDRKLQIDPPETSWNIPVDSDTAVTEERTSADTGAAQGQPAAAHAVIAGTSVLMDPKHPLRIGPDYYPAGALRREQAGRCIVRVTVAADGKIIDSSLQSSSGFPLLDEACLSAVRGQRMVAARREGKAIQSTASVPIVWKLGGT